MVTETANGGIVRDFMVQTETAKVAERYAVFQIVRKLPAGKAIPGLQQKGLEHAKDGIGWFASRVTGAVKILLQILLNRAPVDNLANLVRRLGPALAPDSCLVRESTFMIEPCCH
jgi:hypothetical protein